MIFFLHDELFTSDLTFPLKGLFSPEITKKIMIFIFFFFFLTSIKNEFLLIYANHIYIPSSIPYQLSTNFQSNLRQISGSSLF